MLQGIKLRAPSWPNGGYAKTSSGEMGIGSLASSVDEFVVHFRCVASNDGKPLHLWDASTDLGNGVTAMGLLRHRHYLSLIPEATPARARIRLVGAPDKTTSRQSPNCARAFTDLQGALETRAKVTIHPKSTWRTVDDDWRTLASAKTLLCGLSEYCLTAAMANRGGAVYFPFARAGTAFFAPSPSLDGILREHSAAGFNWVPFDPSDIMLARNVSTSPWEAVREFLNA